VRGLFEVIFAFPYDVRINYSNNQDLLYCIELYGNTIVKLALSRTFDRCGGRVF
jgi:hypothetical protein